MTVSVSLCLINLQAKRYLSLLEPRLEKMKKQREKPMWLDRGRPNLIAVPASKYSMSREGRAIAVIIQWQGSCSAVVELHSSYQMIVSS